jgi:replicative DNA helicase
MERNGTLEDTGGRAGLMHFAAAASTSVHVEYYARRVAHYAMLRRWITLGAEIVAGAYKAGDEGYDPSGAISDAQRAVESLDDPSQRQGPVPYADLMPDLQDWLHESWRGEFAGEEIPTGFRWIDDALNGGFRRGELTLLAARPSMGKTAMCLQLAHEAARYRNGERGQVVVFSAEMSTRSLLFRAVSEVTGIPPQQIRTGKVPPALRDTILYATEHMATMPVHVDDTSGITTAQMIARVQRLQRAGPVALVVFDYIEIAGDTDANEERRVGKIGGQLKHLARVCDVPVLALCQLSRAVEQRKDRKPQMSDLRYSGSLEAHADVIMMLYRASYYADQGLMEVEPGKEDITEVIIAKQRNGVTGTFPVRWYPSTMRFSDLDVNRDAQ